MTRGWPVLPETSRCFINRYQDKVEEYVAPLQGAYFVFGYLFPKAAPWSGMFVPYRDGMGCGLGIKLRGTDGYWISDGNNINLKFVVFLLKDD